MDCTNLHSCSTKHVFNSCAVTVAFPYTSTLGGLPSKQLKIPLPRPPAALALSRVQVWVRWFTVPDQLWREIQQTAVK